MRWFSHRRRNGGRHNCISYLLTRTKDDSPASAYHSYAARGVGSGNFFCPWWPLTLTFELWHSNSGGIFFGSGLRGRKLCRPPVLRRWENQRMLSSLREEVGRTVFGLINYFVGATCIAIQVIGGSSPLRWDTRGHSGKLKAFIRFELHWHRRAPSR